MSAFMQPSFDWLLGYEIDHSTRHRRFLSLVMVGAKITPEALSQVLSDAIRTSDISFPENSGLSLVMGETGTADAVEAINRYKQVVNGSMDLHYSVASFPSDGKTMTELKHVAQRRLAMAKMAESGAVVTEG